MSKRYGKAKTKMAKRHRAGVRAAQACGGEYIGQASNLGMKFADGRIVSIAGPGHLISVGSSKDLPFIGNVQNIAFTPKHPIP